MDIDYEIIFIAVLPHPLIQEGQLSVTDESNYVHKYWLMA